MLPHRSAECANCSIEASEVTFTLNLNFHILYGR